MLSKKILLAALLGCAFVAPAGAQTTLAASSWVPPTHLLTQDVLMAWAAAVEKATNGRVKTTLLPKAVSAAPGTLDAVRDGLADVSYISNAYLPGRLVLTKVGEFYGGGDTAEHTSVAYQRIFNKYPQMLAEFKGVKVLGVFTHGPGQIYNTKKQIAKLSDMDGLKFRVGGGVAADTAKALGVSYLVKPAPESYELLSQGVADGVFFPMESLYSFKLNTLIKYITILPGGFYNTTFTLFMNEDKWNKLSKADQDAITSVSGETFARMAGKAWDVRDDKALADGKAAGIATITASPAFQSEVKQKVGPMEQEWVKEASASRGIDAGKALADFRAETKNVAAGR
jgi:TRAP-type C4-dicarboxylate transport system substrate-binding protein